MEDSQLQYYIDRYITGTISGDEWDRLKEMLKDPVNMQALDGIMDDQWKATEGREDEFPVVTEQIISPLLVRINEESAVDGGAGRRAAPRVYFLRRWGWVAAAVFIVVAVGILLLVRPGGVHPVKNIVRQNILPGTNRALLTLSDGTTINLDSAANGALARQGNSDIIKLSNGGVVYTIKGDGSATEMMNTMATPKGGQYMLTLSDGTKAWLNAASSITYPAVFTGKARMVKVTGEVYLEVAKDASKPFWVDAGGQMVQVLGTSFNINAYGDDGGITTTLLEGSIKVSRDQTGHGAGAVMLKPGEQGYWPMGGDGVLRVRGDVDVTRVMAWKNGLFNFEQMNIQQAMKQLERWYDVQVKYEGRAPDFRLRGGMDRNVKLSDIISFLADLGVEARLEGRTLIVSGK